jgi:hypothetical protein
VANTPPHWKPETNEWNPSLQIGAPTGGHVQIAN